MIINFLSRLFVSLFVCFFFCLFAILPGGVPGHHPKMINYLGGLGRWCSATSPPILPLYNKLLLLLPVVVGGSLPPILPLSPAVRRPSITLFYPRAIPFSCTPLYKQAIGVCELPCLMENVILWFCPCTLFCPCVVFFCIFWSCKVGDAGNGGFGCAIGLLVVEMF